MSFFFFFFFLSKSKCNSLSGEDTSQYMYLTKDPRVYKEYVL